MKALSLAELVRPELLFLAVPGVDGSSVLRQMADRLATAGAVADGDVLFRQLLEREQLGSTGIGKGVAIPHCKLATLKKVVLAVGVTSQPVDFQAVDGDPVRVFFLIVSPDGSPAAHLQSLAAISRWIKTNDHLAKVLAARDHASLHRLLQRADSG